MAQELSDFGQRGALAQHPCRQGMAQQVRPFVRRFQRRSHERPAHDGIDGHGTRKAYAWRPHADEHPTCSPARPPIAQIGGKCLTDIHRQWESSGTATFTPYAQQPRMPIDILQAEVDDFAGSQPQTREQQ